uniref:Uncharacterized protein n=1 Tax=Arundo donax TaxID=35708 RepID=A0A0A9GF94_ARUDO
MNWACLALPCLGSLCLPEFLLLRPSQIKKSSPDDMIYVGSNCCPCGAARQCKLPAIVL